MTTDEKTQAPEVLFTKISSFVSESRELLKSDSMMDLQGLEARVQELCKLVLGLSQDDRIKYADKLQVLLGDIGKLGEEMASLRDVMANEIRSISKHKKANVAYKVADASDAFGKRDEDN
jgi:hypothetical protein